MVSEGQSDQSAAPARLDRRSGQPSDVPAVRDILQFRVRELGVFRRKHSRRDHWRPGRQLTAEAGNHPRDRGWFRFQPVRQPGRRRIHGVQEGHARSARGSRAGAVTRRGRQPEREPVEDDDEGPRRYDQRQADRHQTLRVCAALHGDRLQQQDCGARIDRRPADCADRVQHGAAASRRLSGWRVLPAQDSRILGSQR